MDEYIKREDLISTICMGCNEEFSEEPCEPDCCAIRRAIKNIPAADVVPKSEEGAECPTCHGTGRIGTTNWLTQNMTKKQIAEEKAKAISEHERHIKALVAREIFEEIDGITDLFAKGLIGELEMYDKFAELKKKYTEGKQ